MHNFAATTLLVGLVLPLVAPMFVRQWDCGSMVDRAAKRVGLDRKVIAADMGVSEPQLSRQIAGCSSEHLSLDRLTRLPERFWIAFWLEVGEHFAWVDNAESRDRRIARRVVQRAADRDYAEKVSAA